MRFTVPRTLDNTKKPSGRRPLRVASSCGGGGVFREVVTEGSWRPAPATGRGQEGEQEETDTDASEYGEEEKAFFEDLRRVSRGELISAARVDLPKRISISRRLGLLGKKARSFHGKRTEEAGAATNQPRKAGTRASGEVEDDHAEREEEEGSAGGGGLCEKKILLGRRSKATATSGIEEMATAAAAGPAVAAAFQKAERP